MLVFGCSARSEPTARKISWFSKGQCEVECRALVLLSNRPDLAVVALYDARDGRKTNTSPCELLRRMKSLEWLEEFARVFLFEARAVVAHIIGIAALIELPTELDPNHVAIA